MPNENEVTGTVESAEGLEHLVHDGRVFRVDEGFCLGFLDVVVPFEVVLWLRQYRHQILLAHDRFINLQRHLYPVLKYLVAVNVEVSLLLDFLAPNEHLQV